MKKSNVLVEVENCISSIFTKEDVLKIINSIDETSTTPQISENQIRNIARNITTLIEEEAERDNIVSVDDVEFELTYNKRIEVTEVPINFDAIRDCIEEGLTGFFEELEEETINEKENISELEKQD